MYDERREKFSIRDVILQILFVVIFILILIWLFPMKGDITSAVDPLYQSIFNDNINTMKDAAQDYFTTSRLPSKVGDTVKLTLSEMLEMKIVLPFLDSNSNQCDLSESYVEITKMDDEYVLKINLSCTDNEDYVLVYMGCYDYCDTDICEKEEDKTNTNTNTNTDTKKDPDPTPTKTVSYEYSKTFAKVYSAWSAWSDSIIYVDADGITAGCTDLKCIETSSAQEKIGTVTISKWVSTGSTGEAIEKTTYSNYLGTYYEYTCDEYSNAYFYKIGSYYYKTDGETYVDTKNYSYIPDDTAEYVYKFVGFNDDSCVEQSDCSDCCTSKPYIIEIYKRTAVSTSYMTKTSAGTVCTSLEKTAIKVYGPKTVFVTYKQNWVKQTETQDIYATIKRYKYKTRTLLNDSYTLTKWSTSSNNTSLINSGYKLTGNTK
ncbi:MAG: hypothetical protein PHE54_02985 [Bacilli bacterium]|nr:hypothetical protein [Bacilli bacterium]